MILNSDVKAASITRRFFSLLVDALVVAIPICMFFLFLLYKAGLLVYETFSGESGSAFKIGLAVSPFTLELLSYLTLPLLISIWAFYMSVLEYKTGQTLGKRILKIKVQSADLTPERFGQAFVRHLFDIIDFVIGLLLVWLHPMKQRLGDRVAKTIVIKAQ